MGEGKKEEGGVRREEEEGKMKAFFQMHPLTENSPNLGGGGTCL